MEYPDMDATFLDDGAMLEPVVDAPEVVEIDLDTSILDHPDLPPILEEPADLPNFDGTNGAVTAGDPLGDAAVWHEQETGSTCAVASQEFVLEQLTGLAFDESDLAAEATQNGWYEPGGGTSMMHMDSLLEAHGVSTETHDGGTLDDLAAQLGEGNKVIVSLDASEIWEPGMSADDDASDRYGPGLGADHAVQVTGIVETVQGQMVVLNDPGSGGGQACMIPAEEFVAAWADSGSFYVAAGPNTDDSIDAFGGALLAPVGTSTAYGETTDGDPVSYSHADGSYYNDRTGDEVQPVSSVTGT